MSKIDLQELAGQVAELGGLKPSQANGLAWFFRMVEKEAFCAGVRLGRGSSYASEPSEMYEQYRNDAIAKAAAPAVEAPMGGPFPISNPTVTWDEAIHAENERLRTERDEALHRKETADHD